MQILVPKGSITGLNRRCIWKGQASCQMHSPPSVPKASRTNSTIFKSNAGWGEKKKQHSECNYANVLDNVIEKKGCRQGERWQAINPRAAENGDSCHLCNRKDLAQVWGWEKLSAVSENDSHCLGKLWILVPSLACWSCSAGLLESSLRSQRQRDSGLICEK